ncbi:hypothetical protein HJFPF1_02950 [Paramyrothecium foliicola]|nr:hypothetical protein HJFPF1_02950 [Paramyrothecium foliicola]
MSADLFAEFSNPSSPPQPSQGPSKAAANTKQGQGVDWFQASNNAQPAAPQPAQPWSSSVQDFGDWETSTVATQQSQLWPSAQPQKQNDFGNRGGPSPSFQPPAKTHQTVKDEDDDGWGDFEVAQTTESPTAKFPSLDARGMDNRAQLTDGDPPRTRLVRASTMELITNSLVDVDRPSAWNSQDTRSNIRTQSKPPSSLKNKQSDPNVLFDVAEFELGEEDIREEDDDDFDEFGDFETTAPPTSAPSKPAGKQLANQMPSMDLLSLDEPQQSQQFSHKPSQAKVQKQPPGKLQNILSFAATSTDSAPRTKSPFLQSAHPSYPQAPKSPTFQQRNPFPQLAVKTPETHEFNHQDNPHTETPVTAWPSFTNNTLSMGKKKEEDDGWGAWEDDGGATNKTQTNIDSAQPPESWDWDAVDDVKPAIIESKSSDANPPPINVPPPSIILSVFPDLLASGSGFFKPMSKQSASIKQQVLADPKAVDFLQGYVLLATTAARVIAGRKHRWHRDKILAKSMSISAAGSKGMKLAGVDKTQSAREDREAADVVVAWRENVGRLRSAVAAANAAGKSNIKIPELSDNLQIQTAKMVPTAAKPCIVCGLKREERITKVDFDVEDSFGEWWVEHWGHRACKNFWVEHESKLRQR